MAETKIQKALDGATIPDVTEDFDRVVFISLLIPTGDPTNLENPCNMGLPTIFWGLSGIGKSRRIEAAAARLELPVRTVYPATKQPEDFSDVPVVIKDTLATACLLTQVNDLNAKRKGVLFVDEASLAVPAVQGSMLSMVLDRRVGSTQIHPDIRIILAANPPKFAAGGWGLEAPFANRMFHFFVDRPSKASYVNWLMQEGSKNQQDISAAMSLLRANWGAQWAKVKGLLAGFIQRCTPESYSNQPEPGQPQAGYCWPSPRSWEMAARAFATVRAVGENDRLAHLFIEGAVGTGPAAEFLQYIAEADLPDPKDVLEKGWKIDTKRLDRTIAVTASVVSFIVGTKQHAERLKYAELAWGYLHQLCDTKLTDTAVVGANVLINEGFGPATKNLPASLVKAAEPVMLTLAKSPLLNHA
jgi:hypothetical protein